MSHPNESPSRASPGTNGTALLDCYVLEVYDEIVGLVILDGDGCVFHAVIEDVWALDGYKFQTTRDARQAVRELMAVKRRGSSPCKTLPGG